MSEILRRALPAVLVLSAFLPAQGLRFEAANEAVRKPLTDNRKFEHETLAENGLRVLAIEDPRAAKAGFAVAVEAGSFYDPVELPGLAHFCEHLLFLGTKKYPDEASFDTFMAQHDGSNNAYTEQEKTVFYNEIGNAGFDEGMDRFAQFFIAPLFKGDLVARELNAVNSEHEKNKPDAGRRMWEVLRGTASPDSVLSRFYTGTTESLHHGDNTTIAALRKYHDENYCAPRMSLVMVSNQTTSAQLEMARRHFSAVPRGTCGPRRDFGKERAAVAKPVFGQGHIGQFVRMGTDSTPSLWMMFPLPPTLSFYKEAPLQYLEYALAYAGPQSLRSVLKNKGLVTGMGLQADETTAATLLFVMFDLTPEGAKDEGVQQITERTFAELRMLAAEQSGSDVPSVYESLKKMNQVNFDYLEAPDSVMDAVSGLAAGVSNYPIQDVLTASNGVIDKVDVNMVRGLLNAVADPRNVTLALAAPGFNASQANKFEQYYNIHFSQTPIPAAWTEKWAAASADGLRTAPALRYVPSATAVRNASAGDHPKMSTHAGVELWWQGKGGFALPKVQLRLKLALPKKAAPSFVSQEAATEEALRKLHAELTQQVLEEAAEDMRNCGMDFSVKAAASGYVIEASGYDEHISAMLSEALGGLLSPAFTADQFARSLRQVTDELSDTTRSAPYELAIEVISALTTDGVSSREDTLAALGRVDEKQLRDYLKRVQAGGLRAQLLVVGNVDEAGARDLADKVADGVKAAPSQAVGLLQARRLAAPSMLAASEARHPRVLVVNRTVEVRMKNPVPDDANHAIVNSYQYGVTDVSERVRLMLLGKMIENPVYDELRTKKQLGYIVFGFITEQVSVLELRVLVQGNKEVPDAMDADIETVIKDFGAKLHNLSQPEFLKWKGAVRSALYHKDQNMGQEADRYWAQIANDGHCFNRKELALQYLDTLHSAADVVKTFDTLLGERRKVSVKLFGKGSSPELPKAAPAAKAALVAQPAGEAPLRLTGPRVSEKSKLVAEGVPQGDAAFYQSVGVCQIAK